MVVSVSSKVRFIPYPMLCDALDFQDSKVGYVHLPQLSWLSNQHGVISSLETGPECLSQQDFLHVPLLNVAISDFLLKSRWPLVILSIYRFSPFGSWLSAFDGTDHYTRSDTQWWDTHTSNAHFQRIYLWSSKDQRLNRHY